MVSIKVFVPFKIFHELNWELFVSISVGACFGIRSVLSCSSREVERQTARAKVRTALATDGTLDNHFLKDIQRYSALPKEGQVICRLAQLL